MSYLFLGRLFGAGVYFAKNADYSFHYAQEVNGERRMFLCHVLLGLWTLGDKTMMVPPIIDAENNPTDRYDSTVNKITNPTIFASCYKDNMVYPAFLIIFEGQSTE